MRSAIKYYLEEQGCTVLASEYNDFSKPLDVHSYEACLRSIEQADYFILLIGTRVGGWFDPEKRISITQQEYREAYRLHQAGKLKLLTFVRTNVWEMREDRKALANHLQELNIQEELKRQIENYQSKAASDSEFIISFINEVGRNRETALALKQSHSLPTGNWIHVFDTFRDVIDAIQTQVYAGSPIEEIAFKKLLLRDLMEILRECLIKYKDEVFSPRWAMERFRKENPITLELKVNDHLAVNIKEWDTLTTVAIHLLARKLQPTVLADALTSTIFIDFESSTGQFKEQPVYQALILLSDEIRKFNLANTSETLSVIFEHSPKRRRANTTSIHVETIKLAGFLQLVNRWINVIELSKAVARHLEGGIFEMPNLMPKSPVEGMDAELDAEYATLEDVRKFINQSP